ARSRVRHAFRVFVVRLPGKRPLVAAVSARGADGVGGENAGRRAGRCRPGDACPSATGPRRPDGPRRGPLRPRGRGARLTTRLLRIPYHASPIPFIFPP